MKKFNLFLTLIIILALALPALGQNAATGRSNRALPQPYPDTSIMPERVTRYGEPITAGFPRTKHIFADEGSYFIATNPTVGTAIAHVNLAAYDDTKPYFLMRNQEAPTNPLAKRIYLDYIKLCVAVIPTAATEWGYAAAIDVSSWAARYTSGASLITPVNANGDISTPSVALIRAGAITAVAGIGSKVVARGRWRGLIPVVYDEYVVVFGGNEGGSGFASGAASGRSVSHAPPVVIGPGQNFALNLFGTSNAGGPSQYEFEIGYWER